MTKPNLEVWPPTGNEYRRSEVSAQIGSGQLFWERASTRVLEWGVKTASGFSVSSSAAVTPGDRIEVTAELFGLRILEPVEVVVVVKEVDRVGFSYRTLPGHPVSGEEAFIVSRHGDAVHITIRSLTRAAPQQPWRALYPLLLIVQQIVRRRYLRALR
ncbi:DUF1990 family protein [Paeniglutamicibacter terrestris]|uniref:DUF1990 domain-containing protein n=1 Tax=Paeniglutamicibacter terrestris TaxID=2723403 RepID=A0ABX1GAI6_9MICC|nr:DUF1990 family protein [Paeniglutamicibacter terrestris]NKG22520.1 DUF1990 domain-containing protein [Paeniglutamicibacter terrestris]